MAWTEADIPDLTGRTAVVTGGNGGLGLATVKGLAGAGADVIMAARNQDKAAAAVAEVLAGSPDASVSVVELDLGDLASVRRAAQEITSGRDVVDILVNNAGLMAIPLGRTVDGFETQFGVNHLGHYAFTAHLLAPLLKADAARVVTVTSTAHHMAVKVDAEDPHLEGRYSPWRAYSQSKLANFYFGLGLDRRFREAGTNAASLIAHPGLTNSDLQDRAVEGGESGWTGKMSQRAAHAIGMSVALGARPQLRAATDPDAEGGEFYAPRFASNGPAVKRPVLRRFGMDAAIESLWKLSERETGVALDVRAIWGDLDDG